MIAPANAAIYRDANGDSYYNACANGLHVCGVSDLPDDIQPYTLYNFPLVGDASVFFAQAKLIASCDPDDADFMVDLMINGSSYDEFPTNRQLLGLIEVLRRSNLKNTANKGCAA